jgi:hypothetical protein
MVIVASMQLEPAQPGQIGAVGQHRQDGRTPTSGNADDELGSGRRRIRQEVVRVEAPVSKHEHVGVDQRQQPTCITGLVLARRPELGAERSASAGLAECHQPEQGIAGPPQPGLDLA